METDATAYVAQLELRRAVAAADRVHDRRTSLFLCVRDADGAEGWGECPVGASPGVDPTLRDVVAQLGTALHGTSSRAREEPDYASSFAVGARAAATLVEAARWDLSLRRSGRSLRDELGVAETSVRFAGVVGIEEPESARDRARALVELGASRLRVKVSARAGTGALRAVLDAVSVPVVADANGSLRPGDRLLDELAALPIAWLEQPFGPGALEDSARLAADTDLRVGLDESVTSIEAIGAIADAAAASVVCLKPTRLGLRASVRALADARRLGLSAYVGGFFEAGLGRAVLAALATGGDLDGDVVAPRTYLESDPCGLDGPVDGRQPLWLAPGMGPRPDVSSMSVLDSWS